MSKVSNFFIGVGDYEGVGQLPEQMLYSPGVGHNATFMQCPSCSNTASYTLIAGKGVSVVNSP